MIWHCEEIPSLFAWLGKDRMDIALCRYIAREHISVTGIDINMHWHRGALQSKGVR